MDRVYTGCSPRSTAIDTTRRSKSTSITVVLVCPKCGSNYLVIRQRIGLELLLMRFTDKRKYMCLGCKTTFRAADRRKAPRAPEEAPRSLSKKD